MSAPLLDCAAKVDRGLVRQTNQDVAQVIPELGIALVADGIGGAESSSEVQRAAERGMGTTLLAVAFAPAELECLTRSIC
jgi:serine/threonine protein phosphatase PrpC